MGDVDVSGVMRDQFENALYDFLSMVNQAFETHNDSINEYNNFMTKSINGIETYFKQNKLKDIHELAKENSKSQLTRKLDGCDETIAYAIQYRILNEIDKQFPYFESKNQLKHDDFIKSANEHNEKLSVELIDTIKQSVGVALDTFGRILDENEFGNVTNKIERAAIQDFDLKKIDDGEVAVREKLIQKVDVIHSELLNIVHAYNRYLKQYNHSMEEYIEKSSSYLKRDELIELHRDTKKQSIDKFEAASLGNCEDISTVLQRKLDKEIEVNFHLLSKKNAGKKITFCQNLINSLVKNAGEEWLVEIKRPAAAWGDEELNEKFKSWKETIFRSFDAENMNEDDISSRFQQILAVQLNYLETHMKKINRARLDEYIYREGQKAGYYSIAGAAFGGLAGLILGGPLGAVAGASAGAAISGGTSGTVSVVRGIVSKGD